MATVTMHRAKTQLSRLLAKACQGEEIIIARGTKPVVRLFAVHEVGRDRKPVAWKEKIKIGPEFFEPLPPEELEGWE
jgi:antitoxin (DNA-binding transcriptional repressor) of toxin-antitoxin stability system